MTCHCGNCEDHRVDSWKMFDHDSVQWTEAVSDEVKDELFGVERTKMVTRRNPRDRTISPDGGVPAGDPPKGGSSVQAPASKNTEKLVEQVKEYAEAVKASRRQLLTIILTTNEKNDRFVVRVQGECAKVLYDEETGIEPMYLGHVSEDYILPLRNLLEGLGYEVQEIFI